MAPMCVCGWVDISFPKVIRAHQIKVQSLTTNYAHPVHCQIPPSLCLWWYDDVSSEIPTFGNSVRLLPLRTVCGTAVARVRVCFELLLILYQRGERGSQAILATPNSLKRRWRHSPGSIIMPRDLVFALRTCCPYFPSSGEWKMWKNKKDVGSANAPTFIGGRRHLKKKTKIKTFETMCDAVHI